MSGTPTAVILFGATGDLARHKLLPALFELVADGQTGEDFHIIAIGRRQFDTEGFLEFLRPTLVHKADTHPSQWEHFMATISYCQMDFQRSEEYGKLAQALADIEQECGKGNRLFYLSVPPASYKDILSYIAQNNLLSQPEGSWSRLVVEKPFGHDHDSAVELDQEICRFVDEERVYRIDHYLGKETVQNLLAFRFANGIFEPLWNKEHIDHIQITVAEEEGIKSRAAYYDATGAFRDVVQNHVLQLLSLLLMEEPASFTFDGLSDAKLHLLEHLRVNLEGTLAGQYQGYREEEGVGASSRTETYAMATFEAACERWQGVPIYIRTGKKLAKRVSEISIQFKEPAQHLFRSVDPLTKANVLTFRLQPDEGISLQLGVKTPRTTMDVQPVQMEFCYSSMFRQELPDAYERILADVLAGDKTLSLREDTIERSWQLIDEIQAFLTDKPVYSYQSGSWGPEEADRIMSTTGRRWLAHENEICNGVILDRQHQ